MNRRERLAAERETLGLFVSGHPLEEFADAVRVHTRGTLAQIADLAANGQISDRDEVSLAGMVSSVAFKTNQKGEPWAILQVEDVTSKLEVLLMAGLFNSNTKQRSRPFETYRHLCLPDSLLRITGELKIETVTSNDEEEEDRTVLKVFATSLEDLQIFQGKGFSGALVRLPKGQCPPNLFLLLKQYQGDLPVQFEYRSVEGLSARVKAGNEIRLRFDADLAEKLAKETGCGLSWTY